LGIPAVGEAQNRMGELNAMRETSFLFSEKFSKNLKIFKKSARQKYQYRFFYVCIEILKGMFLSISLDFLMFSAYRDVFSGCPVQLVKELWLIMESKA